jgi:hypothetical protein
MVLGSGNLLPQIQLYIVAQPGHTSMTGLSKAQYSVVVRPAHVNNRNYVACVIVS